MKSVDHKIKSHLQCPLCQNKLNYDGISAVSCKCGYKKGGYDHIHFVTKNLAVGNESVTYDDIVLDSLDIDFILNVAIDYSHSDKVNRPFISIGLADSKNIDIFDFQKAYEQIPILLKVYDRILVNCMGGGRRSVAVVCWHLTQDIGKFWKLVKKFKKVRPAVQLEGGLYQHEWFKKY